METFSVIFILGFNAYNNELRCRNDLRTSSTMNETNSLTKLHFAYASCPREVLCELRATSVNVSSKMHQLGWNMAASSRTHGRSYPLTRMVVTQEDVFGDSEYTVHAGPLCVRTFRHGGALLTHQTFSPNNANQ